MRSIILGTLFFLFFACFIAIVVEELFLGGRRRRRLEKQLRQERISGQEPMKK
ncbi:hypothetical protein [Geomobilimonas luticola]|uniref:Uncharacterized protein n=1 Tax=Geomobilimonas luticola TaxID=1114878 RepID=A0ABS5SHQ5_9BACT|nr:hypothetical protein [Geomobilimonas luticola]MBT0653622.1 hypothetical protein [Geomobilimonas luticola]